MKNQPTVSDLRQRVQDLTTRLGGVSDANARLRAVEQALLKENHELREALAALVSCTGISRIRSALSPEKLQAVRIAKRLLKEREEP